MGFKRDGTTVTGDHADRRQGDRGQGDRGQGDRGQGDRGQGDGKSATEATLRPDVKPTGNPYSSPQTTTVDGKLQPPQKLVWGTRVILFFVGFCAAVLLYLGFYWWAAASRQEYYGQPPAGRVAPVTSVPSSDDHGS